MKRKFCPSCGNGKTEGGIMFRATEDDGRPIWCCNNCGHMMKRRTWVTKKGREKQARFEEIIKKYDLDCAA